MRIGRVLGNVVSTIKHEAYDARTLLIIQPVLPDGTPQGLSTIAVDYVGAGEGEYVLMGAAPGAAQMVFGTKIAPIKEMVMGILDHCELNGDISLRHSDID